MDKAQDQMPQHSSPSKRSDREEAEPPPLDSAASQKPKQPKTSAAANKTKGKRQFGRPRLGVSAIIYIYIHWHVQLASPCRQC